LPLLVVITLQASAGVVRSTSNGRVKQDFMV